MLSKLGLKTVVFDDFFEEAEPLIRGLDSERISNIFINFNYAEDEYKPLTNIRMVFADLFIKKNTSVDGIAAAINDHITENNGPFILVAWTKHPHYLGKLIERLDRYPKNLKFISLSLDKNDYFESEQDKDDYVDSKYEFIDGKSFNNIREDINKELEEKLGFLPIFLEWEMNQSKSVSKVIDLFYEYPNDNTKTKKYLAGLLSASLGRSLSDVSAVEKQRALYEILNSILNDTHSVDGSLTGELLKIDGNDIKDIDSIIKTELNTKFIINNLDENSSCLFPGNVFSYDSYETYCSSNNILKIESLIGNKIENIIGAEFRENLKKFTKKKGKINEIKEAIKNSSIPIIVNITPYCDFAQKKSSNAKLLFGYLWEENMEKYLLKKTDYLYISKSFINPKDKKKYLLALDFHNLLSLKLELLNNLEMFFRIRKETLNVIQNKFSYFSSRPGETVI